GFNRRVRRTKDIVDAARPHISDLVASIIPVDAAGRMTVEQIKTWRETVNDTAVREAGFAYEGYVRLKLASVRALVARMVAEMLHLPAASREARAIGEIADLWARRVGSTYGAEHSWVDFLLSFDLDYRKRRLYFLIQGQNRLYGMLDEREPGNIAASTHCGIARRRNFSAMQYGHGCARCSRTRPSRPARSSSGTRPRSAR